MGQGLVGAKFGEISWGQIQKGWLMDLASLPLIHAHDPGTARRIPVGLQAGEGSGGKAMSSL